MTPRDTLETVRSRGIRLEARGDKLRVVAPAGTLDDALREALTRHKPALLQYLAGPAVDTDGLPIEWCRACGSPNWWTSHARPGWHCSYCDEQPEPFTQGRIAVIASGAWGQH